MYALQKHLIKYVSLGIVYIFLCAWTSATGTDENSVELQYTRKLFNFFLIQQRSTASNSLSFAFGARKIHRICFLCYIQAPSIDSDLIFVLFSSAWFQTANYFKVMLIRAILRGKNSSCLCNWF